MNSPPTIRHWLDNYIGYSTSFYHVVHDVERLPYTLGFDNPVFNTGSLEFSKKNLSLNKYKYPSQEVLAAVLHSFRTGTLLRIFHRTPLSSKLVSNESVFSSWTYYKSSSLEAQNIHINAIPYQNFLTPRFHTNFTNIIDTLDSSFIREVIITEDTNNVLFPELSETKKGLR